MKVIDEIMSYSDSFQEKTIFEVLDDCIETAQNTPFASINVNWFVELKLKIDKECFVEEIKENE